MSSGAVRVLPLLLLAAAALVAVGCDDDLEFPKLEVVQDSTTLFSLARPELQGLPSAFDFVHLVPVAVERPGSTGSWDVALTEDAGGLALAPPGALAGPDRGSALAVVEDRAFDALTRAPSDGDAYETDRIVPLRTDVVYVVQTRPDPCARFAKFRVLAVDAGAGRAELEIVQNPNCNDRNLVPPDGD